MSAASEYGVALVERFLIPAIDADGRNIFSQNEPATAAGDVIAYLLHWLDANDPDPNAADEAIRQGRYHWDAERGDGDDFAQGAEDHYRKLIEELP